MKIFIEKVKKFWKLAAEFKLIGDFWIISASVLIFIRGISLIFYSIFDENSMDLSSFKELSPEIYRLLFVICLVCGIILVVISKELLAASEKAYKISLLFLILSGIVLWIKYVDFFEIITTVVAIFLLVLSKKHLYRKWVSTKKRRYGFFFIIITFVVLFYMTVAFYIQQALKEEGFIKTILFKNSKGFIFGGVVALLISFSIMFIRNALLFRENFFERPKEEELNKVKEFLKENKGDANTHLVFLKDKAIYWACKGKVMIQYAKIKDVLVVLGDPIGDKELIGEAICEFQNFADKYALATAFYRINVGNLPEYHENGYYFFKLGEEAIVDLSEFDLKGKKKQSLRTAKNKFEKSGFSFEVIEPPYDIALMARLKVISEDWLNGRKEDKFSMGWFNKKYLEKSPIALVKNEKSEIIAFISLLPYYDDATLSIDLMRFQNNSPNGLMEILFLNMILWAKDKGYKRFSLGMAPLSNVGVSARSHSGEKFAKFIFNYGNHWYNFRGLRYFKSKFEPNWEPRFFAYQKFTSLPILMLNISRYINK
ncbi:phosphatidylglycerol lysyltransferase domain-containing protein [Haloimpatiens sp. FM7315]|uniref:phosphatidylglycerol lysyltransferase domain-containing protein n=1 Tax=Haloimpatiens sp. FM7315 TaxID=3298609 RepID=UPI0035A287E9